MAAICGSLQVINGYIELYKLKPIINPIVIYDDEEYILYENKHDVSHITSNCLLINDGKCKGFDLLTIEQLMDDIRHNLHISEEIKIPPLYENPYFYALKYKITGSYEETIDFHHSKFDMPQYLFKEHAKYKNTPEKSFIISYLYKYFRKNPNPYLSYYFELLKNTHM